MPYCIKCGREVKAGTNFCPYCGQRIVQPRKEPPISRVPHSTPAPRGGKLAKVVAGIAAVIMLAIVIVIVLPFFEQGVPSRIPGVEADTDRDGIPDSDEISLGSNPHRMDIFVEVDWMEGVIWDPDATSKLEDLFSRAPVTNPDGSRGVSLHLIWSDARIPYPHIEGTDDFFAIRRIYRDHRWAYYGLLAKTTGGWVEAGYSWGTYGFAVEAGGGIITSVFGRGLQPVEFIFLHELGHTLGLDPTVFRGIDSKEYSYSDYPSAMNYNQPWWGMRPKLQFSSGGVFDDWAHLEREGFTPPAP